MSMNLTDIQTAFKRMGKIVKISQLGPVHKSEYVVASMATLDQAVSGVEADYDMYMNVLAGFASKVDAVVGTLDKVPATCKSALSDYLKKVVAPSLGLSSSATIAAIGEALVTAMTSASAHVNPSGVGGSNADGFAMYFKNNFDIELPQDPSPNVLDAWITASVV